MIRSKECARGGFSSRGSYLGGPDPVKGGGTGCIGRDGLGLARSSVTQGETDSHHTEEEGEERFKDGIERAIEECESCQWIRFQGEPE